MQVCKSAVKFCNGNQFVDGQFQVRRPGLDPAI